MARFKSHITAERYPITSTLRDGAVLECAQILWRWVRSIQGITQDEESDDEEKQEAGEPAEAALAPPPASQASHSARDVHAVWAAGWQRHDQAYESIIATGRHKTKRFKEMGHRAKREARWLLSRRVPPEQVKATLGHIAVMLRRHEYDKQTIEEAFAFEHPWRCVRPNAANPTQRIKRVHTVGPNRPYQRSPEDSGERVKLGELDDQELAYLEQQLQELDARQPELEAEWAAAELIAGKAPPRYPRINLAPTTAEETAEVEHRYQLALSRFYDPFPRDVLRGQEADCTPEDLAAVESNAKESLFAAARTLDTVLQPLYFKRTFNPSSKSSKSSKNSFVLLYNSTPTVAQPHGDRTPRIRKARGTGRLADEYVLGLVVHGASARAHWSTAKEHWDSFKTYHDARKKIYKQRAERANHDLFYINFPDTPFHLSKQSRVMLFPVACGFTYHELIFLHQVIAIQRAAQQAKAHAARSAGCDPDDMLPTTLVSSARLTVQMNERQHPNFYVHLPIALPVPPAVAHDGAEQRFLGFHEHSTGYSFALVTLSEQGAQVQVGDLALPPANIESGEGYDDQYVFRVANAMTALAVTHGAYLSLEYTLWRKQISLDRARNRRSSARPTRRLMIVLEYKSLCAGLNQLRCAYKVAPSRDCSSCQQRAEQSAVEQQWSCPNCHALNQSAAQHYSCHTCSHLWYRREVQPEAWFRCPSCKVTLPARYNAAVVVTQRTIEQLLQYHANSETTRT